VLLQIFEAETAQINSVLDSVFEPEVVCNVIVHPLVAGYRQDELFIDVHSYNA
jgi:hypothetical protein